MRQFTYGRRQTGGAISRQDRGKWWFLYRSLSSVAEAMLPRAEEMRRQGVSWAMIARELRVSESALYVWRQIGKTKASLAQPSTSQGSRLDSRRRGETWEVSSWGPGNGVFVECTFAATEGRCRCARGDCI